MSAVADTAGLMAPRARRLRLFGLSAARHRLMLLYVLAVGPLLALFVVDAWLDRTTELATARRRAASVAHLGAQQQDDLTHGVANLLSLLELIPVVRNIDAGCTNVLRQAEEGYEQVEFISILHPSGEAVCANNHLYDAPSINGRAMELALHQVAPGSVVYGGVFNDLATHRPVALLVHPLLDSPAGAPSGAIIAGMNLTALARLPIQLKATARATVDVIEVETGVIVAQSNGGAVTPQALPADPRLLAAIHANPEGGVETTVEGLSYETGFSIVPGTDMRMAIAVNLPTREVLAAANSQLLVDALVVLGAATFAIVLAWLAADYSLLWPIRSLARAAASIGAGQLSVRVGKLPGAVQELGALAVTFDTMSQQLDSREERIAAMTKTLAESEGHHRLLANNVGDMIARFDRSFTLTYTSPACHDMLGYTPDELIGMTLPNTVTAEDRAHVQADLVRPLLMGHEAAACRYRGLQKSGSLVWLETSGRRLADGSGFVTVTHDISVQKALETQLEAANRQLRVQAMQDGLTGLANRRRFDEMLNSEYHRAQRLQEPLGVLMIDIDHFKALNDNHGHAVGDDWLKAVATTLDQSLRRPGDMVGRYGGEEFVVLLPSTPVKGVLVVGERIRAAVAAITLDGRAAGAGPVKVSVGAVSMVPAVDDTSPRALLERADAALYEAKNGGRNCVRLARLSATIPGTQTA